MERVIDRAVGKNRRYFISNAPIGTYTPQNVFLTLCLSDNVVASLVITVCSVKCNITRVPLPVLLPDAAILCCGVVWCGVVWCGVVWCGVVWCVMMSHATFRALKIACQIG